MLVWERSNQLSRTGDFPFHTRTRLCRRRRTRSRWTPEMEAGSLESMPRVRRACVASLTSRRSTDNLCRTRLLQLPASVIFATPSIRPPLPSHPTSSSSRPVKQSSPLIQPTSPQFWEEPSPSLLPRTLNPSPVRIQNDKTRSSSQLSPPAPSQPTTTLVSLSPLLPGEPPTGPLSIQTQHPSPQATRSLVGSPSLLGRSRLRFGLERVSSRRDRRRGISRRRLERRGGRWRRRRGRRGELGGRSWRGSSLEGREGRTGGREVGSGNECFILDSGIRCSTRTRCQRKGGITPVSFETRRDEEGVVEAWKIIAHSFSSLSAFFPLQDTTTLFMTESVTQATLSGIPIEVRFEKRVCDLPSSN